VPFDCAHDRRPDALLLPEALKDGDDVFKRQHSVLRLADRLLEVDRAAGEKPHVRPPLKPTTLKLFVTRDPADTINYPIDHCRSGQPRYRWEQRPDGIELGWLRDPS
jgi:hypothetical protein